MMCKESKNTYLKKKYKELYVIFDGTQTVSLMKKDKKTYLNAKIGFKYVNQYEFSLSLKNQIWQRRRQLFDEVNFEYLILIAGYSCIRFLMILAIRVLLEMYEERLPAL